MLIRSYNDSFLSLAVICTLLILTISSCDLNSVNNADNSRAWVSIDPIQCLGNPWEQDWLKEEGHTYKDYPKGDLDVIEDDDDEDEDKSGPADDVDFDFGDLE